MAAELTNFVLLTHELPQPWIEALAQDFRLELFDPASPANTEARALLTSGGHRIDAALLDRLPALDYICCVGSGYEAIDVAAATDRRIAVTNAASITAEDVADHAVALVLASLSRIPDLDRGVRIGCWDKPVRRSLSALHFGIVGLGAIGAAIARRMEPFGCEIRWAGPRAKPSPYRFVERLGSLADWADIVMVAARADASNRRLIDAALIDRIGPHGLLANVSRGSIVDEDALIAALRSGRLGAATLDVFETEPSPGERWRDVPNCVLTPHVGGYATGVQDGILALARSNLRAFFAGQPLVGQVNEVGR